MTKFVMAKPQLLLNISAIIFACIFSSASSASVESHVQISDLSVLQHQIDRVREIQLSVSGRDYTVRLWPSHTTNKIENMETKHYAGNVVGDNESWVRFSYLQNQLTGYMKAFGELLEIDTLGSRANAKQIATKVNSVDLHERTSGLDRVLQPPPLSTIHSPTAPPTNRETTNKGVTRIMPLSIVIDSRFDTHYKGRGLEKAVSTINAVDGLYQEQFGLAIELNSVVLFNETNDPFLSYSGNIEQLLRAFRAYSLNNKEFSENQTAVHLFSGSNDEENIIGLSWINTACRKDGYNASVSTPFSEQMLLAAHEIAHNLGAVHDNAKSCEVEYDKIMWPHISSATAKQFSGCSKASVVPKLNASCNLDNVDIGISLELKQSAAFERQTEILAVSAHNTHSYRDAPDVRSATLIQNGIVASNLPTECFHVADTIYCNHGNIKASSKNTIEFDISYLKEHTQIIQSEIDAPAVNDVAHTNDNAVLDLNNPNNSVDNTGLESETSSSNVSAGGGGGGSLGLLLAFSMLFIGILRKFYTRETPNDDQLTAKRNSS